MLRKGHRQFAGGIIVAKQNVCYCMTGLCSEVPCLKYGPCMLIGAAFYHDIYRRTPDGWKISATGYDRTYEATMSLEGLNFKLKPGRALHI